MERNDVIMAEWFDEHWYKVVAGKVEHFIASVTTKLDVEKKYGLDKWRGDVGNREADRIMNEAGERGKRIHKALQTYLLGGIVVYNPWNNPTYTEPQIEEMRQSVNGVLVVLKDQREMLDVWKLQRFFDVVKPRIAHVEHTVYSVEKDIAGTLDMALEIKAGKYLVSGSQPLIVPETGIYIADLKTGKVVDDTVWCQLAPYSYAYEDMGLGKPVGAMVLHTGSTTQKGIPGFTVKMAMRDALPVYLDDYFHLSAIWKRRNPNAGPEIFQFPTKIQRSLS